MNKSRKEWIDIGRGVGIILVVLGHMDVFRNVIYSFHMPLFFFISGFLYKERDFKTIVKYVGKKLIMPYLIWGFGLSIAMWLVTKIGIVLHRKEFSDLKLQIVNILRGGDAEHIVNAAPALWFLIALAEIVIIYWVIEGLTRNLVIQGIVITCGVVVGILLLEHGIICTFNINVVLNVMPFYFCGRVASKCNFAMKKQKKRDGLLMICILLLGVGSSLNGEVNVHIGNVGEHALWYYINALCGIVIVGMYSIKCADSGRFMKKMLCSIGQRTVGIMCIHAAIIVIFSSLISVNVIIDKIIIFMITIVASYCIAVIYDAIYNSFFYMLKK